MPLSTHLPPLADDYPITRETAGAYQRDGHILLRSVAAPPEIAAYRSIISDAADRFNTETRSLNERDTYGKAFLQITNLWRRDEAVARYVLSRRFAKIAAELMGVDGVRIYHDQALFKEAGGGPTPWHQDQFYWPMDTDKTITMWMPLVDVPVEKGALTFASGSHRNGSVSALEISDASEEFFENHVRESGCAIAVDAMQAGDATFHSGWTLHHAPANRTDSMREVMTIIYYADGARAMAPDHPYRKADLETWFPEIEPGEIAASELNPLVYKRP